MLRIELKPSHSGQPGYGELTVHEWPNGDAGLELTVQRNQDGRYLDATGGWGSSPVWHGVEGLGLTGDTLSGELGPWLIDPLMQDPQMAYKVQIRDSDGGDYGVLRILGTLLSSMAAGNSAHDEQKIKRSNTPPPPAPVPEPEPEPLPVAEDEPQLGDLNARDSDTYVESLSAEPREPVPLAAKPAPAPAPAKKSSKLWLIIMLLVLLAAIGAALWWFVLRAPSTASASTPAASASSGEAPVCSAEALGQVSDDLVYIQSCLKSNPDSAQVLAVVAAAKAAKRCGVVQRLYAHKAQSGDAAVAFAYAREYDPESFASGGCISAADAETAVYWYEIAVTNDPTNQQASQRLEALRK